MTVSNILIVEDTPIRIKIFNMLLKGCEIETASNANDAIELLRKKQFNNIFLDYNLIGSKSIEVAKYIKENVPCHNIKFLIHSNDKEGRKELFECLKQVCKNIKVLPFHKIKLEMTPEELLN